ncbi:MAG: patatin-like phospholipase family protein [Micropepsaceae bacterium]
MDVKSPSPPPKARIGLALGGGAARGWAHIGALRRLEELGVKPDIVCGTSVGALAGGFWLAGQLDGLEAWARALTKRRMLSYFDLMLTGSSLMGGQKLKENMQGFIGARRIEDLRAEFVAVTAELATGHEIWLRSGPLAEAIEAAYALPGVFPPRAIGGRWLIDGALVNPLPVSVCRALGARVVIAVGLHADAFGRPGGRMARLDQTDASGKQLEAAARGGVAEKLMLKKLFNPSGGSNGGPPGLGTVMLASFNIVMDRITRARLAGDPPDVLVSPQVGHIPLLDFDRADELIALGREAVDYSAARIERAIEFLASTS